MAAPVIVAELDPRLSARVVQRTPLRYALGASVEEDRPEHVRSASGLALVGDRLAVVQDDAAFVALIEASTFAVRALSLPSGPGGARQFDDLRGNKRHKLDLEACLTTELDGAPALLAFGSGSTPARETLLAVRWPRAGEPELRLVPAPALYAALRAERAFSGSELNLEGAVRIGDRLRLFQRGNGAARAELTAVDATADVPWAVVLALLAGTAPRVTLGDVVQYRLGELQGARLTFTDAALASSGAVAYLASAERSPDAVRDGEVTGSVLGVIEAGRARYATLLDRDGAVLAEKAEGLLLDASDPTRARIVVDADDPARASELCVLQLNGPWW